jgi:hypothetical protein
MTEKKFKELCIKHGITINNIDTSLEDDRNIFIENYLNSIFLQYTENYINSVIEKFPHCIDCTGIFEINNKEILILLRKHNVEFSVYHENFECQSIKVNDYKFNNEFLHNCTIEHFDNYYSQKNDITYAVNGLKEIEILLEDYMPIIKDFKINTDRLDIYINNNYGYYCIGEDFFDCSMTINKLKEFLNDYFPIVHFKN